jgi:hypothetical protein
MKFVKILVLIGLSIGLFGCISQQSFIDPSAQKFTYDDIKRRAEPVKLRLSVEFQRNGLHFPKADSTLKDSAERTLRATGVIIPTDVDSVGEIKIIVNNIADIATAAAKGAGTGLTFGLIGSTVQDNYELTMTMTINGQTITKSGIKNSIFTTVGNAAAPDGVQTSPVEVAFSKVLEQMILQALKDVESNKELGLSIDMHQKLTYKSAAEKLDFLKVVHILIRKPNSSS